MPGGPEAHVDGVEDSEQGETPRDTVDDGAVTRLSELVDDGAEEQDMNDSPAIVLDMVCSSKRRLTHQMRKAHGAGVM